MSLIRDLGSGVYQLELIGENRRFATTGFFIDSDKKILIETGAAPSNSNILKAMAELGWNPGDLDLVVVTHIHLDHSGGAGLLMSQCEKAHLLCHERAKFHLCNPEKLIASARVVYGNSFEPFFDPILSISDERVSDMSEGEEVIIAAGRSLKFFDSPGHALHHFIILDSLTKGIFSGDAAGMFYNQIQHEHGVEVCLPATTPTQFDPEAMLNTLNHIQTLNPEKLYFTHFGMSESPMKLISQAKEWVPLFGSEGVEFYKKNPSLEKLTGFLLDKVLKRIRKWGVPDSFSSLDNLAFDVGVNAQGVIALVRRLEKTK